MNCFCWALIVAAVLLAVVNAIRVVIAFNDDGMREAERRAEERRLRGLRWAAEVNAARQAQQAREAAAPRPDPIQKAAAEAVARAVLESGDPPDNDLDEF